MPPSWNLEDAQKLADDFPYTFYKPSATVVARLKPGNLVKLIFEFESNDPGAPRAERMWVQITKVSSNGFRGQLDNDPVYIRDLHYQDVIEFSACHIIDTDQPDPEPSITRKYLKRCYVTNNILYQGQPVGYLYREEPEHEQDSGWRFTTGTETDAYMDDASNLSFVSLGAVLREGDSFVHLLEREPGVAFARDEQGNFVELE